MTILLYLIDQLQSEQGARFYQKRNRNIIIRVPNNYNLKILKNHRWLTMGQILKLAQKDNTINMDTRSVISSLSYEPERVLSKKSINVDKLKSSLNNFTLSNTKKIDFASQ